MTISESTRAMAAQAAMAERGALVTRKPLPLRYWRALAECRAAGLFGGVAS